MMLLSFYLLLPSGLQGVEVALACKEAGVQHFIYSSQESVKKAMGIPCPHMDGKAEVEDFLQVLRPLPVAF